MSEVEKQRIADLETTCKKQSEHISKPRQSATSCARHCTVRRGVDMDATPLTVQSAKQDKRIVIAGGKK